MTGELWPLRFIWHHDLRVTHCQSSAMSFIFMQYTFCNSFKHCLIMASHHGKLCRELYNFSFLILREKRYWVLLVAMVNSNGNIPSNTKSFVPRNIMHKARIPPDQRWSQNKNLENLNHGNPIRTRKMSLKNLVKEKSPGTKKRVAIPYKLGP